MGMQPELEHENLTEPEGEILTEVHPNVWRIAAHPPGSHVYLINDRFKRVLIDSGIEKNIDHLTKHLGELGLVPADIDLVINTHEHFDHIGGNPLFFETAFIAAHRFAATKIELQDEFVTHAKENYQDTEKFQVHLWLENRDLIVSGDYKLKILHTPGHTSGCICIYEPVHQFMFTGDTLLAGGHLPPIMESGSAGDYVNSLQRLSTMKIKSIFPSHGSRSDDPDGDLERAIAQARERLTAFQQSVAPGRRRRMRVVAGSEDLSDT
jgi:glyoxylase-like metal-dependent hydrolase (beta-lactamase superfamily II)